MCLIDRGHRQTSPTASVAEQEWEAAAASDGGEVHSKARQRWGAFRAQPTSVIVCAPFAEKCVSCRPSHDELLFVSTLPRERFGDRQVGDARPRVESLLANTSPQLEQWWRVGRKYSKHRVDRRHCWWPVKRLIFCRSKNSYYTITLCFYM